MERSRFLTAPWRAAVLTLALVSLIVTGLAPGSAVPGDAGKANQYRAEFISDIRAPPHTMGTLYLDDEVLDVSVSEAADMYAERLVAFVKRAQEAAENRDSDGGHGNGNGRNGGPSTAQGANEPAFAYAGFFHLKEVAYYEGSDGPVACSDSQAQRHATYSVVNPFDDQTGGDYIGAAYSDVAAFGSGYLEDTNLGTEIDYAYPVFYSGISDFYCFELRFQGTIVFNGPNVYGGIIVGVDD